MALATVLITGAGIPTPVSGLGALEEMITIGTPATAMPLQGLNITLNGETTYDVPNSQPLMSALAKLFMPITAGPLVALVLRVATGRINVKADGPGANIRLINNGATTPNVFTTSTGSKSRATGQPAAPIKVTTDTVNPNSNKVYKGFSGLLVTPIANVSSIDLVMWDGTPQNITVIEADSLYAAENATEANGKLDPVVCAFDNRDRKYQSVKINANATAGGVTVAIQNLPQQYFEAEKKAVEG